MGIEDPLKVIQLLHAIHYATLAHHGQVRKFADEPYIAHPIRVGTECYRRVGDIDLAIAGVLHDVPEDTDRSIADIDAHFGRKVANWVEGVTKRKDLPKADQEEEYLKRFRLAPLMVIELKLIDRLDNLSHGFADAPAGFKERYTANTETLLNAVPENYRTDIMVVETVTDEIRRKISGS